MAFGAHGWTAPIVPSAIAPQPWSIPAATSKLSDPQELMQPLGGSGSAWDPRNSWDSGHPWAMTRSDRAKKETKYNNMHMAEIKNATPPASAAKFGPGRCVSVWRDGKTGHCIMHTDCDGQDTSNHTFGLVCKELDWPSSLLTRHEFGKDSFAANESFDTLIQCHECLPLDDTAKEDPDLDETLPQLVSDWRWRTLKKGLVKDIAGAFDSFQDLAGEHSTIHQKSMQLRGMKKDLEDAAVRYGLAVKPADTAEHDENPGNSSRLPEGLRSVLNRVLKH